MADNELDGTHFYGDGCEAPHGRNTVCEHCGEKVPELSEYQSHVGRSWRGHKDCTEEEAARWVVVERDDLYAAYQGDPTAWERLRQTMEG